MKLSVSAFIHILAAAFILAAAAACPAMAQPDEERTETVKNGTASIHIVIRGHGDPIVFIPSLGRGVGDFDDLSKRLVARGYEAILPQPRGIGGSVGPLQNITLHDLAADAAAVIRSHGEGPVILVGHAYGNRVARMVSTDYPRLVKRVILLAAGGMVPRAPEVDRAFNRVFDATLSKEERLAAIQQTFFARGNDAKVWENGWYFDVARAQRAEAAKTPVQEWWAGGSAPILVLQATDDVIAVPENSRRLATEFPNRVTVIEIPNSGHAMLPEQPERIAAAILTYLRR
jgi:pimeloyl-ACP methyl ester carboxylesterase